MLLTFATASSAAESSAAAFLALSADLGVAFPLISSPDFHPAFPVCLGQSVHCRLSCVPCSSFFLPLVGFCSSLFFVSFYGFRWRVHLWVLIICTWLIFGFLFAHWEKHWIINDNYQTSDCR